MYFSDKLVSEVSTEFIRNTIALLETSDRLIGIKGARGVGKTTLLLQFIKTKLAHHKAVYVTLDDIFFSENRLIDFIDDFVALGGEYVLLDEVHKYPNWSQEIKNAYDRHSQLKIIFTGSSILKIREAYADLSRRAVVFNLEGFSFREYLNLKTNQSFPVLKLTDILEHHQEIVKDIWKIVKPLAFFESYLRYGYYPFFLENQETYHQKLREIISLTLEIDLPYNTEISHSKIFHIKQLLYIIAERVPFKPNIQKISERIATSRNTLKQYLHILDEAQIIALLFSEKKGMSSLTKPEKIYLHHPNLMYSLSESDADVGTVRETFFLNQLSAKHEVFYTEKGDFRVDRKYTFEVGGKNKDAKQIQGIEHAFLAKDGLEAGFGREIPLWLFGFLY
jgi:hypothetical protein